MLLNSHAMPCKNKKNFNFALMKLILFFQYPAPLHPEHPRTFRSENFNMKRSYLQQIPSFIRWRRMFADVSVNGKRNKTHPALTAKMFEGFSSPPNTYPKPEYPASPVRQPAAFRPPNYTQKTNHSAAGCGLPLGTRAMQIS